MLKSLLLHSIILLAFNCQAQQWTLSPLRPMPQRVSNNAVCEGFINGQPYVYSFAGIDSTKTLQGIHLNSWRYDLLADEWQSLPTLPDTMGKIAAAASRVHNVIYIIGGYHVASNQDEISSDKVHRFEVTTNQFLPDGQPVPVPIDDQVQAVWRDSLIYVISGWSNGSNVSDVQIYHPAQDIWIAGTPLPANESYRSFGSSGTIIGDTIFYFGGARFGFNFPAQANFRKGVIDPNDPTQISWSVSVPNANRKGYRMAAAQIGHKALWIGGSELTYNFDGLAYSNGAGVPPAHRVVEYDTETGVWSETNPQPLPMDLRGIADLGNGTFVLLGGMLDMQTVSNQAGIQRHYYSNRSTIHSSPKAVAFSQSGW